MSGILGTFQKQPADILDFDIDFTDWLAEADANDALSTVRFALGRLTDIGAFTYIQAVNGVTVEDEVQIGSHCAIYSVSTIDGKEGPVVLRRNCRIGSHCVVMPGVTVGENAVVGAFSFVTPDVPAGAVACGVPARVRRA